MFKERFKEILNYYCSIISVYVWVGGGIYLDAKWQHAIFSHADASIMSNS